MAYVNAGSVVISDNDQGNQVHDASTGKFTSPNGGSIDMSEEILDFIKTNFGDEYVDHINSLSDDEKKEFIKKIQEILNEEDPPVRLYETVDECIDNIETILTEDLFNDYKNNNFNYALETSPGSRKYVNMWTTKLGAIVYKNKKCNKLAADEVISDFYDFGNKSRSGRSDMQFKQELGGYQFARIYRGISDNDKEFLYKLKQAYTDEMPDVTNTVYGNGIHGTCIYTTVSRGYADDYASGGLMMHGFAKVGDANLITEREVQQKMSEFLNNTNIDKIKQKIVQSFAGKGISDDEINKFITGLVGSIRFDETTAAVLLGYDAMLSEAHQINVLNPAMTYFKE